MSRVSFHNNQTIVKTRYANKSLSCHVCHSHMLTVFCNECGFVAQMTQEKDFLSLRNCTSSAKQIHCSHDENDCRDSFSRFHEFFENAEFWLTSNMGKSRAQLNIFHRSQYEMTHVKCECDLLSSKQKSQGRYKTTCWQQQQK